jgi:excisionase family DNA binding protein
MAHTDGTYRPGVSIHEAAVMLGVSPTTVRRWVASGKLRSERYDRPQGEVVRVFLGPEQATPATVEREQVSTVQVPTDAPPRAEEQVSTEVPPALTAWSSAILAPIMAELSVSRETIRQQAETIGELRAENRALVARTEAQSVEPSPEPPTPLSRLLALWRWLVLVLVVAVTTMIVLLVWPR